jgi:hypothetical protein
MKLKVLSLTFVLFFSSLALYGQDKNYWQQEVEYQMEIDVDAENHQFTGSQTLTYHNNSPDTLRRVFYHLYFNAFQPNSMMDVRSRTIEDPDSRVRDRIQQLPEDEIGYHHINRLQQDGSDVEYTVDGTILEVTLDEPILPGESTVFSMDFDSQVPRQIRRSGWMNKEGVEFSMSQWYPKISEYDEDGWHPNPYVAREFHGVWGSFDVSITIDSSYVMGATGQMAGQSVMQRQLGGEQSAGGGQQSAFAKSLAPGQVHPALFRRGLGVGFKPIKIIRTMGLGQPALPAPARAKGVVRCQHPLIQQVLRQQIMDTVTQVQLAYFDLIAARENVLVQERALELAEQLLADNQKRVQVGQMAPLDVQQAESEVAARRADLISARNVADIRQNELKNLLTDNFPIWQDLMIQPTEELEAIGEAFNRVDSWQKGLTLRPEILQSQLELEKQDVTMKFNHNQLFPQLDLIGSFGYSGRAVDSSGAYEDIGAQRNPNYSFGVQISIPLGNLRARKEYQIAKSQKEQLLVQHKRLEQNIMVEIDNDIKQAQTSFQRVEATREARQFAEAALEAEQKKLDEGKSTSFEVLRFQRDLTERRSAEISALTTRSTCPPTTRSTCEVQ